jgi:hypothetical protein
LNRGSNDIQAQASLRLLIGDLCLLSSVGELDTLINVSLANISRSLFQMLDFDVYDVRRMESKSTPGRAALSALVRQEAELQQQNKAQSEPERQDQQFLLKPHQTQPTHDSINDPVESHDDQHDQSSKLAIATRVESEYPAKIFKNFSNETS